MEFTSPSPFAEAIAFVAQKKTLPTNLSSAELRAQIGADGHRAAITSARTTIADYLNDLKNTVLGILEPKVEQRPDRVTATNPQGNVNVGVDPATARLQLKIALAKYGYSPDPEEKGTIKDLSSDPRLNLVIKTNRDIAQGFGYFTQRQDVLTGFPGQELIRIESRKDPRDWQQRWLAAARASGDADAIRAFGLTGRMVARMESAVWQALGDGAIGYESDALGNPFPPFAFGSGMGVRAVSYTECLALNLIVPGHQPTPQRLSYPVMEAAA